MEHRTRGFGKSACLGLMAILSIAWLLKPTSAQQPPGHSPAGPSDKPGPKKEGDAYATMLKQRLDRVIALEQDVEKQRQEVKDQLSDIVRNAEVAAHEPEAKYSDAFLGRKMAEIALIEYRRGISVQERETAKGEIALAEEELKRAKEQSRNTKPDQLRVQQAELQLDRAQTQMELLTKFLIPKRVKELESDIERARSVELGAQMNWEISKVRISRAKHLVEKYKVFAPEDIVLALMDDAIQIELKAAALLDGTENAADTAVRDPDTIKRAAAELKEKREKAGSLMEAAKNKLSEAVGMAEHVTKMRISLRLAEDKLRKASDELESLKKIGKHIPH